MLTDSVSDMASVSRKGITCGLGPVGYLYADAECLGG
jgi:hypothetical protein